MRQRISALLIVLGLSLAGPGYSATLLPNGKQTFVDLNGQPLASGQVYFYIPATTTPKTTWQDSNQSVPNVNPVVLDAAGRAVIYGSGTYRQIVKDQFGNIVWDQLTQGYGSGSAAINTTIVGSTSLTGCSGFTPINNGSAAPITITMPTSPTQGDTCQFADAGGNAAQYQIKFAFGSNSFATGSTTYIMNENGAEIGFTWLGTPAVWAGN